MKSLTILLIFLCACLFGQDIRGIQLFNPQTNDETPVIGFNDRLILKFDDFSNSSTAYRYTIRHLDRNWQEDGLFFTEYANGSLNALIDQFQYSFNTFQKYTNYTLTFPNDKIQPKISGNFELIVYKDSASRPVLTKRFSVVEAAAEVGVLVSRTTDARNPHVNQRVEVQASGPSLLQNINSVSLTVMQNNNPNVAVLNQRPTTTLGNRIMFQQMALAFPGNMEFYYFDNKIINQAADMVSGTEHIQ